MSKQIIVFGDSIAYGAWDEEGGWVERLKVYTNKKAIKSDLEYYCAVYNLAIDGDITTDLLRRIDLEIRSRVLDEERVIIIAMGSNDSEITNFDASFRTKPEIFRDNIREIISISGKYSSKILFLGLLPVDESKVDPIPWSVERSYKNKSIKKFEDIIKSECNGNKADFVGLFDQFFMQGYEKMLVDGVHPNSEGHRRIFEIVSGYLKEKEII